MVPYCSFCGSVKLECGISEDGVISCKCLNCHDEFGMTVGDVKDLERAEETLNKSRLAGIYDVFDGVSDAISQMSWYIKELEGKNDDLYSRIAVLEELVLASAKLVDHQSWARDIYLAPDTDISVGSECHYCKEIGLCAGDIDHDDDCPVLKVFQIVFWWKERMRRMLPDYGDVEMIDLTL